MGQPRYRAGEARLGVQLTPVVWDLSFKPYVPVAWVLWDVTMPYNPKAMAEEIAAGLNCRHEARLAMAEDKTT